MPVATKERKSRKAKAEKPLPVLIARVAFKQINAIVYVIKGEEKIHHVTIVDGKATGCCHADDNETCTGFSYRKTCGHVKLALAAEEKRIEEMCEAIALAPVLVGEIEVHVEDEFSGEQQTEEIIKQEYAILERERRASAPLQPSGHSVEETGFGFIPMRRAS